MMYIVGDANEKLYVATTSGTRNALLMLPSARCT